MDIPNSIAREKLLRSLPIDTFLILFRASLGLSNKEIAKWGRSWSFTEEKIQKVFKKQYELLDLEFSKPGLEPREALCAFMLECKALGLLLPKIAPEDTARGVPADNQESKVKSWQRKKDVGIKFSSQSSRNRESSVVLSGGFDINNKEFKNTLFKNIKLIAKVRKMPMSTIAKNSGLQPSFLSFLKRGQVSMNVERLTGLSGTIGVRTDFLLTSFLRERDEISQEIENASYSSPESASGASQGM
jgi:hypothetical protein